MSCLAMAQQAHHVTSSLLFISISRILRKRCLVWDFTCPDTLTASHLNRAVIWSCGERRGITEVDQILVAFRPLPIHSHCD